MKRISSFVLVVLTLMVFIMPNAKAATYDVSGINTGTAYYFKNIYSGKYMHTNNNYSSIGTNVNVATLNSNSSYKWKMIYSSANTYIIQNLVTTNRYLTVNFNNAIINAAADQYANQKFTVNRITSGQYAGLYRIKKGNYYLICSSDNNVEFSTVTFSNNDLWCLEKVEKGTSDFFCFKYPNGSWLLFTTYYDSTGISTYFQNKYTNMGYSTGVLVNHNSASGLDSICNSDIVFYNGHGDNALISFRSSTGSVNGRIKANTGQGGMTTGNYFISNQSANALANSRMILLFGCRTGLSASGYNMVDTIFAKGGHFAIAPKNVVRTYSVNRWIKLFSNRLNQGYSVKDSMNYANSRVNLGTLYYKGDVYQKIH